MLKNLLIRGQPKSGKSTLVHRIAKEYRDRAGGVVTREVRLDGERIGFEAINLRSGACEALADKRWDTPWRVGDYCGDLIVINDLVTNAIREATAASELVVIDEIARMQIFSPLFCAAVLEALRSSRPVLATVHGYSNVFSNLVIARSDVTVLELTPDNRAETERTVRTWLAEHVPSL